MPTYNIPIPPSVNHLWRHGRSWKGKPMTYREPKYLTWLQMAGLKLKEQGMSLVLPPVRMVMRITGGRGWNRARDLDNGLKCVLDLLRQVGIIAEDNVQNLVDVRAVYEENDRRDAVANCVVELETVK